MYPLKAILIGCTQEVGEAVRAELTQKSVEIEAEFADVNTALSGLNQLPDAKHLFIMHLQGEDDLRQLKRLTSKFTGRPILALVSADSDQMILMSAMRAGAAQVVLLPLDSEDFRDALDSVALQFGIPANRSRVIAVAGCCNKCGSTTITLNLAYEMSQMQSGRCILAELAAPIGRLATYLSVEPRFTTQDLVSDPESLSIHTVWQALTPVLGEFYILTGPFRSINTTTPEPRDVLQLIDHLRRLADTVVLDVPPTLDRLYFEVLAAADQVILMTEPTVPGIESMQMVRQTLARDHGVRSPFLVINRYDAKDPSFTADRLKELMKVPRLLTIANDSPAVLAAVNNGRPLQVEAPHSHVLEDVRGLARVLLGIPEPPRKHRPGLLRLLFGKS